MCNSIVCHIGWLAGISAGMQELVIAMANWTILQAWLHHVQVKFLWFVKLMFAPWVYWNNAYVQVNHCILYSPCVFYVHVYRDVLSLLFCQWFCMAAVGQEVSHHFVQQHISPLFLLSTWTEYNQALMPSSLPRGLLLPVKISFAWLISKLKGEPVPVFSQQPPCSHSFFFYTSLSLSKLFLLVWHHPQPQVPLPTQVHFCWL